MFLICGYPDFSIMLLLTILTCIRLIIYTQKHSKRSTFLTPFSNKGFPGGSDGKVSARHVGDPGSIPGSGRSPEEGTGNPLQYSCLGNPMDREASWARVHGGAKSQT